MNGLEWFNKRCEKCQNKLCKPKGQMVYIDDSSRRLECLVATVLMAEIDRASLKRKA